MEVPRLRAVTHFGVQARACPWGSITFLLAYPFLILIVTLNRKSTRSLIFVIITRLGVYAIDR